MTGAAGPARRFAGLDGRGAAASVMVFLGLLLLYLLTAPANHALGLDTYWLARLVASEPITEVRQPRLFLWIAAMQGLHVAAASAVADPDPFRLIGFANAIQAALAVTLFARLLMGRLAVDPRSAWLSAGLLGSSYGIWRYATEIEVYATAALLSVALLLAAFAVDRGEPARLTRRVLALACLGGVVTLVYQPIGFVAGIAIPFFLLIRLGLASAALYCALAGAVLIVGLSVAYRLSVDAADAHAVAVVLDAERVPSPKLPDLMTLPEVAYAVSHDLLSTNWSYAFEPFRSLFERAGPETTRASEVFAAEQAGWIVWVGALTLPIAAVLLAAIAWTAVRQPSAARLCAREATLVVWLAVHAAMMIVVSPADFEGWILALVPMAALAARRLVAPTVAAGRGVVVGLLLVVFLMHNGLAGIGVLAREDGDYLRARGGPLVERSGADDLIVMGRDRRLQQYLRHAGRERILRVKGDGEGLGEARREIDATLAEGGRVLIAGDAAWAPAGLLGNDPALAPELDALARGYPGAGPRVPTGDTGWSRAIAPEDGGR